MTQPNIISVQFCHNGKNYALTCKYDELDRDYEDEGYAYFLYIDEDKQIGFEINILKDCDGYLITDGYVVLYDIYLEWEIDGEPIINDVKVEFQY